MQYVLLADGRELLFEKALALPDGRLCAVTPERQEWFAAGSWVGYSDRPAIVAMARKRSGGFTFERASETEAKPLKWLWDNRILLGFINVLLGMEKIGKGNLVAYLAAQVTHGELAGALYGEPRDVLIFGHEDSWERVWVPRLRLAGADMKRVRIIHEIDGEPFNVAQHGRKLAAFVRRQDVALVYFDQFLDTIGVGTNENRVKPIRDALNPLAKAAQRTQCAFIGTLHPNKRTSGTFRDVITGTPAWNQVSRSGLFVAAHPSEPGRRVLVVASANYSSGAESFEFEVTGGSFQNSKGDVIEASYIDPDAITYGSVTEADLMNTRAGGGGVVRIKAGQGKLYLKSRLNGSRVPSRQVKDELLKMFDIQDREAKRLARDVGVQVESEGFPRETYWSKPDGGWQ